MAIIQALLVGVEEEIYALPLNNVAEVIEINKSEVTLVQNNEVIVLRDTVIPIFKLHKILEVPDYKESDQKIITVIIIKTQNKYFGVVVDKLVEQQEVVIKPVNKKLCPDNIVSGATTLGSGKVALILNVNGLS
jgi:two-component system chemotaxis sensor kinase CheA